MTIEFTVKTVTFIMAIVSLVNMVLAILFYVFNEDERALSRLQIKVWAGILCVGLTHNLSANMLHVQAFCFNFFSITLLALKELSDKCLERTTSFVPFGIGLMGANLLFMAFYVLELPFTVVSLPICAYLAGAMTYQTTKTYSELRRRRRRGDTSHKLLVITTMVFAFHILDYPFTVTIPWVAKLGYLLALCIMLAYGFLVPLVIFEVSNVKHYENARKADQENAAANAIASMTQMIAHEFRRPFTALGLMLEQARTYAAADRNLQRFQQHIATVYKNVDDLIVDLLMLGQNSTSSSELVEVDVPRIFRTHS